MIYQSNLHINIHITGILWPSEGLTFSIKQNAEYGKEEMDLEDLNGITCDISEAHFLVEIRSDHFSLYKVVKNVVYILK